MLVAALRELTEQTNLPFLGTEIQAFANMYGGFYAAIIVIDVIMVSFLYISTSKFLSMIRIDLGKSYIHASLLEEVPTRYLLPWYFPRKIFICPSLTH